MIAIDEIEEAVKGYQPLFDDEKRYKKDLLKRLRADPSITMRENAKEHVVVSAFLVDENLTRLALIRHRKLERWLQVGGHLESTDETVEDAVYREISEETGINRHNLERQGGLFDIDIHEIPGNEQCADHVHYDLRFLFVVRRGTQLRANPDEAAAISWFSIPSAVINMQSEASRRLFLKLKR